jgi:hypothetical protein
MFKLINRILNSIPPMTRRVAVEGALWVLMALCTWFSLTRHFIVLLAVSGRWQAPGVMRVTVGHVQRDLDDFNTDILITVKKDGSQKMHRLLKDELVGVKPNEKIWLIRPLFVTAFSSPPYYRFGIFRLVQEFPELFLLLGGYWLFARFRSRLGKPYDAYEGAEKPSTTYVVPDPESWGRSRQFFQNKDQDKNS